MHQCKLPCLSCTFNLYLCIARRRALRRTSAQMATWSPLTYVLLEHILWFVRKSRNWLAVWARLEEYKLRQPLYRASSLVLFSLIIVRMSSICYWWVMMTKQNREVRQWIAAVWLLSGSAILCDTNSSLHRLHTILLSSLLCFYNSLTTPYTPPKL